MTFVPKIERTQEDIEKTLKGLLKIESLTQDHRQTECGIVDLSDRYRISVIEDNGSIKNIDISKILLDNGIPRTQESWQAKSERKTRYERQQGPLRKEDVLEERWMLPSLPEFTRLIMELYKRKQQSPDQETAKNFMNIMELLRCGPYMTSTLTNEKMSLTLHDIYTPLVRTFSMASHNEEKNSLRFLVS